MNEDIGKLIMALRSISGEYVTISISHKLYGNQKIKCEFSPILDRRVGFKIQDQDIYVYKEDVQVTLLANYILFADEVMEIKIEV